MIEWMQNTLGSNTCFDQRSAWLADCSPGVSNGLLPCCLSEGGLNLHVHQLRHR